jgi:glycosyltransferase involved in cell wall biosynthesis
MGRLMAEPTFTVIIPAYNERELVTGAIRSVQRQSRSDWEAIVVDDGSTDGTADVVRPFTEEDERVRLVTKENGGLSAARNTAIAMSRAPLLSFLDSDDLWLPGYLDAMATALDADPEAAVAYTDAWALDTDSGRFRRATAMSSCQPPKVLPREPSEIMMLLIRQNFIWVSTTIRRSVMEELGGFNEDFRLVEDLELWSRVLKAGHRIVRAPGGVLGIKREREEQMSRQELGNLQTLKRLMAIIAADEEMPADVREAARARIDDFERERQAVSGESPVRAAALRNWRRLGRVRRATLGRIRDWRPEPPDAVQQAFPDLDRL